MKLAGINTDNITNDIIKEVLFSIPKSEYTVADCIMVFGCHLKNILDERIDCVIETLQNKKVNKILLSGGVGVNGDFNEAEYMKQKLLANGINEDLILIENTSTTTEENIINNIKIIRTTITHTDAPTIIEADVERSIIKEEIK